MNLGFTSSENDVVADSFVVFSIDNLIDLGFMLMSGIWLDLFL